MSDWVVPLATLFLTAPAALIALYRSFYGRDHVKMQELEDRILRLEGTLKECRSENVRLAEDNYRLMRRVVEGPDCPAHSCPVRLKPQANPGSGHRQQHDGILD